MDKLKLIKDFLDSQSYMVVATSSKGKPEAALVGFAYAPDLSLVFGTQSTTRKYKNFLTNPNFAIVFGNEGKITVQYEGIASELTEDEAIKYKDIYFQKTPSAKKYEHLPDQVYKNSAKMGTLHRLQCKTCDNF